MNILVILEGFTDPVRWMLSWVDSPQSNIHVPPILDSPSSYLPSLPTIPLSTARLTLISPSPLLLPLPSLARRFEFPPAPPLLPTTSSLPTICAIPFLPLLLQFNLRAVQDTPLVTPGVQLAVPTNTASMSLAFVSSPLSLRSMGWYRCLRSFSPSPSGLGTSGSVVSVLGSTHCHKGGYWDSTASMCLVLGEEERDDGLPFVGACCCC
mmetsp:Transcript_20584/g.59741  ORF Transcript_20584/g.59741 Transcript_20584/m.59741 type:complete len:209 (-) Transcript_20584:160-786(-)